LTIRQPHFRGVTTSQDDLPPHYRGVMIKKITRLPDDEPTKAEAVEWEQTKICTWGGAC